MNRRQNFQNIAWFNDLYTRELLNLDPPYQRRSVWTQSFRDYFMETILLDYPAPTIFLYEEINDTGITSYNVVDGKQRLTTIFAFLRNEFPVSESSVISDLQGKLFQDFSSETKNSVWSYTFSVEYLPSNNESIINNIFDRINKNVAKLTSQELRHAKYSGIFISACETLAEWMFEKLPANYPQIARTSRSQMKDIELVAQILLRLEGEPRGYNTNELDEAFNLRDDFWDEESATETSFRTVVNLICEIVDDSNDTELARSRLRNQADFYSLFGALYCLEKSNSLPDVEVIGERLKAFINHTPDENSPTEVAEYLQFARVASNRTLARKSREEILIKIIGGDISC